MKFLHSMIRVSDPDATVAFFQLLGLEERRRMENEAGRFTLTVTAVDLPNNTVSVIDGPGGAVQTYKANTIAKQDMLKKIKVGDVVISLTTPLMVTAVSPAN